MIAMRSLSLHPTPFYRPSETWLAGTGLLASEWLGTVVCAKGSTPVDVSFDIQRDNLIPLSGRYRPSLIPT